MTIFRYLTLLCVFAPVGASFAGNSGFLSPEDPPTRSESTLIDASSDPAFVRLKEIGYKSFNRERAGGWLRVELTADSMGKVRVSDLESKGLSAEKELSRFMKLNSDILGDIDGVDFRVSSISELAGHRFVRFTQSVDGVEMPESAIAVDGEGDVKQLQLMVYKPTGKYFERSNWLTEEAATLLARQYVEGQIGKIDEAQFDSEPRRSTRPIEGSDELMVVYEFVYRGALFQIDAISGEVVWEQDLRANATRSCDVGGNLYIANCDPVVYPPGTPGFEMYYDESGVCVHPSGTSACVGVPSTAITDIVVSGIVWSGWGYPGPADWDIQFHSPYPNSHYPYPANQFHVIVTDTAFWNAPAATRSDTAVHEYGHAWMWKIGGYNKTDEVMSTKFGEAYAESLADLYRALSALDWTSSTPNPLNDRVLTQDHTYGLHTAYLNANDEHGASLALSRLFYEIYTRLGQETTADVVAWMLATAAIGAQQGNFDIDNYRDSLKFTMDLLLSTSQKVQVCDAWSDRGFPGDLECNAPNAPFVAAAYLGCEWFVVGGNSYYGAKYLITWTNVNDENGYRLYSKVDTSTNPWVHQANYAANVTTSLPNYWYSTYQHSWIGVEAYNEYGASNRGVVYTPNTTCGG